MAPPLPKKLHRKLQTDGSDRSSGEHRTIFHMAHRARLMKVLLTSRNGLASSRRETKPPLVTFTAGQEFIPHSTQYSWTSSRKMGRKKSSKLKKNELKSQATNCRALTVIVASSLSQPPLGEVCGLYRKTVGSLT